MKKCTECGKRFDDSAILCDNCNSYLIADVVSDLEQELLAYIEDGDTSTGSKRRKVGPVKTTSYDPVVTQQGTGSGYGSGTSRGTGSGSSYGTGSGYGSGSSYGTGSGYGSGGFEPSRERIEPPTPSYSSSSGGGRYRSSGRGFTNFIRRFYPVVRIIIPLILVLVSVIFIIANWASVREFLRCCIISGIIGGVLLTSISIRFSRNFDPLGVVAVGTIGGMVIGCLFKYNVLGTATSLVDLVSGLVPSMVTIAAIIYIIRGGSR